MKESMQPYALSLLDYLNGNEKAETTIHRDDCHVDSLRASFFFREDFSRIERRALELCEGRVLDVGAGAGPHSLALQEREYDVCAIDISPEACEVMRSRGVRDVRCGNIFDFHEAFDTLLLMDKGIGMVETLPGLDRFLKHAREIGKLVLLDSIDVTKTKEEDHLRYHERMRRAGRYFGEVRLRFEYKDLVGPEFGWLHVDPDTLGEHASVAGWKCAIEMEEEGDYLARLF